MKKIYRFLVLGAALSLSGMSSAWAGGYASLLVVEGDVMVNHGSGFQPAVGVIDLKAGDRILAGENASAILRYATCSTKIKPGSVVTVAKSSLCLAGIASGSEGFPAFFVGGVATPVGTTAGFAAGFVGLVGLHELLTSSPATN
jgi:hypothetical protein